MRFVQSDSELCSSESGFQIAGPKNPSGKLDFNAKKPITMRLYHFLFALCLLLTSGFCAAQFDGFALYNGANSYTSYLIDENGNIAHSWSCNVTCNYTVLLKPNGNIIRGGVYTGNQINVPAVGGLVQEIDPSGNVVWEFQYSDANHVSHHDLAIMPNGNVLLLALEKKTSSELIAAGYTKSANFKYPSQIIEVQQNGTGGQIVWQWNIWDHLIQDADSTKANYGVIADHPELLDINVAINGTPMGGDWFHENGIDYNEDLDQIAFSARYLSEIFIIDHSVTTLEAAGHTGGNGGKGGDFLYRWGNPFNYDMTFGLQNIFAAVHDVKWVKEGCPNEGYLQFFNNQGNTGGSSKVDAINPPLTGFNYTFTPNSGYGPVTYDWRHNCLTSATGQSASDRLPNGDVFATVSGQYMYEVDSSNNLVWQYASGPMQAQRYTCDYPGIDSLFNGSKPCTTIVSRAVSQSGDIRIYPNPSTGRFFIAGLENMEGEFSLQIADVFGRELHSFSNVSEFDISDMPPGIYVATILLNGVAGDTRRISLAM